MGGARMPPGVINGQHSHETAEVFLVHRGQFSFEFGPNKEDGELEIGLGGIVSIPTRVFRGFRNSGDNLGHLVSIIGKDDPGRVTWAPYIFRAAQDCGLILTKTGNLIDTSVGEAIPDDDEPMLPTTEQDLASFDCLKASDLKGWYLRASDIKPCATAPLTGDGVSECLVIGPENLAEGVPAAPIAAPHEFHLRRVRMQPGASVPIHARQEVEVLFVHSGQLVVSIEGIDIVLNQGDYFTVPMRQMRSWHNRDTTPNDIQVVRGGDHPSAPVWHRHNDH
jgi:quercetin dioxygenase-like cupin family protein